MENDILDDYLYKLKRASFFYANDQKLSDYIEKALDSDDDAQTFYRLLKSFLNDQSNQVDTLRLHLAFRRLNHSGRYQMHKDTYDLCIDDASFANSNLDLLESLL